jgi:hypothetical protein
MFYYEKELGQKYFPFIFSTMKNSKQIFSHGTLIASTQNNHHHHHLSKDIDNAVRADRKSKQISILNIHKFLNFHLTCSRYRFMERNFHLACSAWRISSITRGSCKKTLSKIMISYLFYFIAIDEHLG